MFSLSAECLKFKDKIPEVTASCAVKLAPLLKQQIITGYFECLGRQKGSPPSISGLHKEPSISKLLSTSFDQTLASLKTNLEDTVKDPCSSPLFPHTIWDTVAFFDYAEKHTMVCARTPPLARKVIKQSRYKRKARTESPKEKAMKSDICKCTCECSYFCQQTKYYGNSVRLHLRPFQALETLEWLATLSTVCTHE